MSLMRKKFECQFPTHILINIIDAIISSILKKLDIIAQRGHFHFKQTLFEIVKFIIIVYRIL